MGKVRMVATTVLVDGLFTSRVKEQHIMWDPGGYTIQFVKFENLRFYACVDKKMNYAAVLPWFIKWARFKSRSTDLAATEITTLNSFGERYKIFPCYITALKLHMANLFMENLSKLAAILWCFCSLVPFTVELRQILEQKGYTQFTPHYITWYCPEGTMFLKSIDTTDIVASSNALYELMKNIVEEVGEKNIVQVVTNYSEIHAAAGKRLGETFSTLFWSPCTYQCINGMLEDFSKVGAISEIISNVKAITGFIYSSALSLNLMKKYLHGKDLLIPAETHVAMNFVTLKNMYSLKEALQAMVSSDEWIHCLLPKKPGGIEVSNLISILQFWSSCAAVVKGVILKGHSSLPEHLDTEVDQLPWGHSNLLLQGLDSESYSEAKLMDVVKELSRRIEAMEKKAWSNKEVKYLQGVNDRLLKIIFELKDIVKKWNSKTDPLSLGDSLNQFVEQCLGSEDVIYLIGGFDGISFLSSLDSFSPSLDILTPLPLLSKLNLSVTQDGCNLGKDGIQETDAKWCTPEDRVYSEVCSAAEAPGVQLLHLLLILQQKRGGELNSDGFVTVA